MWIDIGLLLLGLVLLVVGGDFLVRGASNLAYSIQISPLVVGLTVVAFGTSAPELLVSLQAALSGSPDISAFPRSGASQNAPDASGRAPSRGGSLSQHDATARMVAIFVRIGEKTD